MADFTGIKLYDSIIIVERTEVIENDSKYNWKGRTVNQGYIVNPDSESMLNTALSWAEWTKHDESLREKYLELRNASNHNETKEEKELWKKYFDSGVKVEGIKHEYKNGQFTLILSESAGSSSQGGKLSFWNCIIEAPDGKQFLVGINQDAVLKLLLETSTKKGVVQEKIWLGRRGGNVYALTETMEDFIKAKAEAEVRNSPKTAKYSFGDIIGTNYAERVYLGEVYVYAIKQNINKSIWSHASDKWVLKDKPKKVHAYASIESGSWNINLRASKASERVFGSNIELANQYRLRIEKYMSEMPKLCVNRDVHGREFYYFYENALIRLTNDVSKEQLIEDLKKIKAYRSSFFERSGRYDFALELYTEERAKKEGRIIEVQVPDFKLYDDYYREGETKDVSFTINV